MATTVTVSERAAQRIGEILIAEAPCALDQRLRFTTAKR